MRESPPFLAVLLRTTEIACRRSVVGLGPLQSLAHFATTFPDFLPRICAEFTRNREGETLGDLRNAHRRRAWRARPRWRSPRSTGTPAPASAGPAAGPPARQRQRRLSRERLCICLCLRLCCLCAVLFACWVLPLAMAAAGGVRGTTLMSFMIRTSRSNRMTAMPESSVFSPAAAAAASASPTVRADPEISSGGHVLVYSRSRGSP